MIGVTTPRQAIREIAAGKNKPPHAIEFLLAAEGLLEDAGLADTPMTESSIHAVLEEVGFKLLGKKVKGILR